jgi:alkylhydroperoxidase family enzyme
MTKEAGTVPSITPATDAEAGEPAVKVFEQIRARVGSVPNMYRTLAHAPTVLEAVTAMGLAIRADLDPKLRELAYLMTVRLTDCHY